MFGFVPTRLSHSERRFGYQQLPLHCLFIILFSEYCRFFDKFVPCNMKSAGLPRVLLSLREVEALVYGCNRGMRCTGSELEK